MSEALMYSLIIELLKDYLGFLAHLSRRLRGSL